MAVAKKPAKKPAKKRTVTKRKATSKKVAPTRTRVAKVPSMTTTMANGKGRPRGKMAPDAAGAMVSATRITRGIGRYLEALREPGKRSAMVGIGRLPGFPNTTKDPEIVGDAIEVLTRRISEAKTPVAELKLRQRVRDLEAARLRLLSTEAEPENEAREIFVTHGKAWSEANRVSYEVWREMGVPAADLKAAGIPWKSRG